MKTIYLQMWHKQMTVDERTKGRSVGKQERQAERSQRGRILDSAEARRSRGDSRSPRSPGESATESVEEEGFPDLLLPPHGALPAPRL